MVDYITVITMGADRSFIHLITVSLVVKIMKDVFLFPDSSLPQ